MKNQQTKFGRDELRETKIILGVIKFWLCRLPVHFIPSLALSFCLWFYYYFLEMLKKHRNKTLY
jgi:hypothetical protein